MEVAMAESRRPAKRLRCAIYTRKSSEEGLELAFNSLHAQREACAAFILSQKHEGWTVSPIAYDDGGFSGGTLDRPALKLLLGDITEGKVDIVVVYKIDRLTRSLFDFAKIVEAFEAKGVSFVSITQQFNTSTSMGRLTLNVLLSFAQFERELAGERIRDKIAASKKKGMWMGGLPPLGYDVKDRKLVVNEEEARTVLHIFRRYVELKSVRALKAELEEAGIRSKRRILTDGTARGGQKLSRGALSISCCRTASIAVRSPTKAMPIPESTPPLSTKPFGIRFRPSLPRIASIGRSGPMQNSQASSPASLLTRPANG
jgi:site-specific DNA recombinase